MLTKVISGGQSGADIAGLAIAKKYGLKTGGCIPLGFKTLDGPKPEYAKLYGLVEHKSNNYASRTYDNVKNSDATIRFYTKEDSSGEICTLEAILQYVKPFFDVNFNNPPSPADAVSFLKENNVSVLNVAGNSEKTSPGIAKKTLLFMHEMFKILDLKIPETKPEEPKKEEVEHTRDPDFSVKEIEKICKEKLISLNLSEQKYQDRLDFEIKQIDAQMEGDYLFDLYEKKLKFAKNENNLLVAYLLDLVDDFDINQEAYMLQGEFPDIDTDFQADVCSYIRNEWAPKTFGEENVCAIGTYGTFGIKQSLIDIARVFGKDRQEILNITTKMGIKDEDGKALSWEKALEEYPLLKEYCENNPEVADAAERLLNRNKSVGTHAGGLIISNQRIDNIVPFVKTSDNIVSAFGEGLSGTDLSPLGLVKIDTLRLTNLTQIAEICRFVQTRHNLESICALPGRPNWSDEDAYIKDEKALKLANEGNLKCIFQFDSDGIRELVKKGGVDSFNDLVSYNSLWRPGPLMCLMDKTFVERKKGREAYKLHPILEPILQDTYGVIIFQEQILKILKIVGLIPDMHCEIVRKAISKKKEKVFKKYKDMFIRNGQKILDWSKEQVEELWQQIQNFAEYGFNKSVTEDTLIPYKKGLKQIKNFVPGDIVYCIDNKGNTVETEVVALHDHGYLNGFEVTFDDGYKIICSEDHKFLTEFGQVPLKEISSKGLSVLCDVNFIENSLQDMKIEFSTTLGCDEIFNTKRLVNRKLIQIRSVGKRHMYDLEVSNSTHNFILPTGIITSNSHSVAYTLVSARLLYLKAHYPLEFFAGTLKCVEDDKKIKEYKREAEKMGIKINPVTINKSNVKFDIIDNEIYMGYSNIKGLGDEAAQNIVKNQPYFSFEDFLIRAGTEEKVVKPLICLRAFQGEDPVRLYSYYSYFKEEMKKINSMNSRFETKLEVTKSEIQACVGDKIEQVIKDTYEMDVQQIDNYCSLNFYDSSTLRPLLVKYKKAIEDNKHKNKTRINQIIKYKDHKLDISEIDEELLNIMNDVVQVAESKFYGFTWNHLLEISEDYLGGYTFSDFENDSEAYVKMCEVQVVEKPRAKASKKGTVYYEVTVEDANSERNNVTFWEEDYLRFKNDLEWWESDTRKGNFIKIRLKKPEPPFKNYTFDSPPKNLRSKEIPENREDDTRLIVMSRPFIPLKKAVSDVQMETLIL